MDNRKEQRGMIENQSYLEHQKTGNCRVMFTHTHTPKGYGLKMMILFEVSKTCLMKTV